MGKRVMTPKELIAEAIPPMFRACGNSYINTWLAEWLKGARDAGVYDGPMVGRIADIDINFWYERAKQNAAQ